MRDMEIWEFFASITTAVTLPRFTHLKYELALIFTVCVWGINFPIIKIALEVMHPHAVNVFRFLVASLVLGGLYVYQQRSRGESIGDPIKKHGKTLFGLGMLGFFFYQYCFIVGVEKTTAGNAALIMASSPLWTGLLGHIFGFDKMRSKAWLGLLASLLGASIIVFGGTKTLDFGSATFLGNALMLAAAFLWGAYTAFTKPVSRSVAPITIAFMGLVFALPLLFALGIPHLSSVNWPDVTPLIWAALVFSGGLSVGLTIVIWNYAVQHVGPSHTAAFGNLVPVVALISGMLLLNETITLHQIAGGILILGGLIVMRRSRHSMPKHMESTAISSHSE